MSKRVLFVINTLGHAGAEMAMFELMDRLKKDCEIDLYVLMGQGELVHRLPEHVRLLNRSFSDKSVLSYRGRGHMVWTILKALVKKGNGIRLLPYLVSNAVVQVRGGCIKPDKLLWRILSEGAMKIPEKYDLAIAFLEGGSAYYVADRVKADKKIAFLHIDYIQAGYTRKLDRDCYLKYDAVYPIADEIKDRFLDVYPECGEKTRVFHNCINRALVNACGHMMGGFQDAYDGKRILTVGRLTAQKAYPIAIEAMKLLKEDGVRARWYVLGEGNERKNLEQKIEEYGLQDDFILMGAVGNPYPYYRQTDLYVHATRFEGKSIAIQEAQILGCAIVASDCTGNREQIEDGVDGLLCELDPMALKEAIKKLLTDDELRYAFKAAVVNKRVNYEEDIHLITDFLE